MAIILRYFAEFGSFRGQLRKSGWLSINKFSPEKCHAVHQLSTTYIRAVLFAVAELLLLLNVGPFVLWLVPACIFSWLSREFCCRYILA